MATLAGWQIQELVESGALLIDPFEPALVEPASYDLRVGSKILVSPIGPRNLGEVIELDSQNASYPIQTGQMVAVLSKEKLAIPMDICVRFGIRSEFARKGIHAFGGVQMDPGWRGRLTMSIQNVGPEPVLITRNTPFFTLEFQRLEAAARAPYAGEYQDQDDFPEDQRHFILTARTTSLAEIPALRQEISRLATIIEDLEDQLPDPDRGLQLQPDVEDQLRRSLKASKKNLITPDEAWRRLGA
ncbi:MAG: dCTP deaminase [Dehalococcoidia bacterium]